MHDCYASSQLKECGCAEYAYLTAAPEGAVCDERVEATGNGVAIKQATAACMVYFSKSKICDASNCNNWYSFTNCLPL